MENIFYRYRVLTALLTAVAFGLAAFAVIPAIGRNIAKTATAAAAPGCIGTQNPFIGPS